MNLKIIFLISSIAFFCIAGRNDAEATELPRSIDEDLMLTMEEISMMEVRAHAGDNDAAAKLARYYDFYVRDYKSAKFWFEHAARNGHVQSQYNLGVRLLLKRNDAESCVEARYWFNMALANGFSEAQDALDYLGSCPVMEETKSGGGTTEVDAHTKDQQGKISIGKDEVSVKKCDKCSR